jgi:hypothetical protein
VGAGADYGTSWEFAAQPTTTGGGLNTALHDVNVGMEIEMLQNSVTLKKGEKLYVCAVNRHQGFITVDHKITTTPNFTLSDRYRSIMWETTEKLTLPVGHHHVWRGKRVHPARTFFDDLDGLELTEDTYKQLKVCHHEWATYDSGWSKYEYCAKCDIKRDDVKDAELPSGYKGDYWITQASLFFNHIPVTDYECPKCRVIARWPDRLGAPKGCDGCGANLRVKP